MEPVMSSVVDSPRDAPVPNLYEIHRGAISITYSASGIDGRPRLHFEDGNRQLDFTGDEVETYESEIGRLITVELAFIPDGETRVLSVLLPQVNLEESTSETRFKALVVFTKVRSTIGGPSMVRGPLQTYNAKAFRGTARAVAF